MLDLRPLMGDRRREQIDTTLAKQRPVKRRIKRGHKGLGDLVSQLPLYRHLFPSELTEAVALVDGLLAPKERG